ncbi:hypothetical protein B0H11DRAFT_787769 [Mycena galericulata]|nr:hypothetical protein B0H11DRAFT_787769 [Mycena galericulata]
MAPLAGRPPFATDEPETFYQSSPQPRPRVPQQPAPEKRTSAYDVYDSYLKPGEAPANRNSGIDALGMGFMNSNLDDSDDDDEEEDLRRARSAVAAAAPPASPSKHAALAAATGATVASSKGPFAPERLETPPPQYNQQRTPSAPSSPSIASPRPGYAAPIAAFNQNAVARPAPSAVPAGRAPPSGGHPNLRIVAPAPNSPASSFARSPPSPFGTPSPSSSPHPLQAPVTPITPVFARPQRTQTMDSTSTVGFSDTKGLIMRGDREETLLPRGRGEKGEQFWRRFSMVAKDPEEKRPSAWLQKTQGGANRLSRWVWIVGIILIICAAGGIGIGVYVSEKAAANYRPDAIGGSANDGASLIPTSSAAKSTAKSAAKGAIATSSALHVTPTNTVARRDPALPNITAVARHAARSRHGAEHFAAL